MFFAALIALSEAMSLLGIGNAVYAAEQAADTVYYGVRVYTLDPSTPWAEAVAVRKDTIVYVGSEAGAESFVGPDTKRQNLDGGLLVPGFIDAHMHVGSTLPYLFAATLSPDMGRDEALAVIAQHARE
jgi:predicted amidohydrolase YtcJ